jgi:hypothetical protein
MPSPSVYAVASQGPSHNDFRRKISTAFHAPHSFGTLSSGEEVSQGSSPVAKSRPYVLTAKRHARQPSSEPKCLPSS